jgi:hypothetical protein
VAVGAALLVTLWVNSAGRIESYWPPFAMWLAALALLGALAWERPGAALAGARSWFATNRREVALVALLTLAALFVRVINLATMPFPFSGDEANHLMQGLAVTRGELRNMFQSGLQGQPTMYYFGLSATTQVFGETVFGGRIFGALLGTSVVPAVYLMLRQLWNSRIAFLGAGWVAGYHLAVHFSRQDLNNVGDATVLALVVLFLWRAVKSNRAADYIMTGLVCGLGLYVNVGCRVAVPLVGAVYVAALLLHRDQIEQRLAGGAFMVGAFLVAAGPLAYFWYQHPNEFLDRIHVVGIYESGWLEREMLITGRSELSLLWDQVRRSLGAFGYYHDAIPHYAGPMPVVDYLSAPFFWLGLLVCLRRAFQVRFLILPALWAGVVITGGILTVDPPTAQRLLATIPASAGFVALGAVAVATFVDDRLGRGPPRPADGAYRGLPGTREALLVALLIVAILAGYNLRYYFGDYLRGNYFSDRNTRVAEAAAAYAHAQPSGTTLYWLGAPQIYVGHPTLRFKTLGLPIYDVLDEGRILPQTPPLPERAVVLALPHRSAELSDVAGACLAARQEPVYGDDGLLMFLALVVERDTDCLAGTILLRPQPPQGR